ncbi:hypothetical protein PoB_000534100 [Plakobranchus ocellatus]|uniref:Uncharacterized protein n=1 Tax=Plakobranchus ocellatus TaxID=259542 RepID=A0AAV3Y8U4_9GAST|nr:hypothetical protein PoB_000534100 [Plakobranchus ocellatus]
MVGKRRRLWENLPLYVVLGYRARERKVLRVGGLIQRPIQAPHRQLLMASAGSEIAAISPRVLSGELMSTASGLTEDH